MNLHQFQTIESVCTLLHGAAGVGMCSVLYAVHVLLLVAVCECTIAGALVKGMLLDSTFLLLRSFF